MKIMLDDGAYMPVRGHDTDAGLDLRAPKRIMLRGHDEVHIDFGVHVQIPHGYFGMLASKSGLNFNCQLDCPGGIIDEGYTGSIKTVIQNRGPFDHEFAPGDKVVQLIIIPCIQPDLEVVESLEETDRGASGFGSTGR